MLFCWCNQSYLPWAITKSAFAPPFLSTISPAMYAPLDNISPTFIVERCSPTTLLPSAQPTRPFRFRTPSQHCQMDQRVYLMLNPHRRCETRQFCRGERQRYDQVLAISDSDVFMSRLCLKGARVKQYSCGPSITSVCVSSYIPYCTPFASSTTPARLKSLSTPSCTHPLPDRWRGGWCCLPITTQGCGGLMIPTRGDLPNFYESCGFSTFPFPSISPSAIPSQCELFMCHVLCLILCMYVCLFCAASAVPPLLRSNLSRPFNVAVFRNLPLAGVAIQI